MRWIDEASKHLGLAEIPGKQHNPIITSWLIRLGAWWHDDETPWCGVFVAHCLRATGFDLPRHWYRARAWADWGTALVAPAYGCVAVFERHGGGHVGFVVGVDYFNRLIVLGGNQGNEVSLAAFERNRVLAYRWPPGQPLAQTTLPIITLDSASSTNEA